MMKWLQGEFDRFEIEWEPFEMYHTRLRSQDYENGAACYIIRIRHKRDKEQETIVRVEDWLKSMEKWIATGKYKLSWQMKNRYSIADSFITLSSI